jgi:hypothetical protein
MHGVYELKKKIIEELEEYGMRNEVKSSELPTIDMLAHTAKNLCKLIEMCENESGYSYGDRYYGRMSRYDDGRSFRNGGRYSRYDDGGYSGESDWMLSMLEELRDRSTNENMRREFDEFIKRMKK